MGAFRGVHGGVAGSTGSERACSSWPVSGQGKLSSSPSVSLPSSGNQGSFRFGGVLGVYELYGGGGWEMRMVGDGVLLCVGVLKDS